MNDNSRTAIDFPDPVNLSVIDPLATAKNVATNGRVFSALMVLINLVAFGNGWAPDVAIKLAVLSALPVGLSCLVDQMPNNQYRVAASMVVYGIATMAAVFSFAMIG